MRVLVTRPEPDNERTAAALRQRGFSPLLARLTEIIPLDPPFRAVAVDAAIATSAHAFPALPPAWRAFVLDRQPPMHVVGDRTADAARAAGFNDVRPGPGDAAGLAQQLLQSLTPRSHVLYLAGDPRKPFIEQRLEAQGHAVETLELYRAAPLQEAPQALIEALSGEPLAVLHFSRASAASFAALAERAGRMPQAAAAAHVCLSADVAAGLQALAPKDVSIAAAPDEASLLEALAARFAQNPPQALGEGDAENALGYSQSGRESDGEGMSDTSSPEPGSPKRGGRRKPQTIDLKPAEVSETMSAAADGAAENAASGTPETGFETTYGPVTGPESDPAIMPQSASGPGPASDERQARISDTPQPAYAAAAPVSAGKTGPVIAGALAGAAAAVLIGFVASRLFAPDYEPRLVALEQRPAAAASAADLQLALDRINTLESRISAAEETVKPLGGRIDALSGLPDAVAALEARAATIPGAAASAADPAIGRRLGAAEERLAALQAAVDALKSAAPAAALNPAVETAARRAALDALARGFASGRDFSAELAVVAGFGGGMPGLETLKAASAGTPTLAALADQFRGLAPLINEAIQPRAEDPGFLQRLADSASSLVEVSPVDGGAVEARSLAGRVEMAIRNGAIDAALSELASLPEPARAAAEPVIDALGKRAALERALVELGAAVTEGR